MKMHELSGQESELTGGPNLRVQLEIQDEDDVKQDRKSRITTGKSLDQI